MTTNPLPGMPAPRAVPPARDPAGPREPDEDRVDVVQDEREHPAEHDVDRALTAYERAHLGWTA